ncbi:EFR1 family ferrodoxin [Peptoniphilus equinus]|uniref:EFR1 family ferrodoxin n=1 Tax=Peptoniphilus equinus TaxID=3016343 RepID=A0ABY7QT29_9FIRM|nr:EFR1 family ferrodoxin [Peptoniphilus equinus]WBW49957.1 EFR1 family ferrodoxin [Peptoniphilus equinus]
MIALYFSGTGNSKFVAETMADHLGGVAYSIEAAMDFDALMVQTDTILVSYPVYASRVPKIMRDFVTAHRNGFRNKKLIILCTQMMYSGDGAKAFYHLVADCNVDVRYADHINMPNNIPNIPMVTIKDSEYHRKLRLAARKLKTIADRIQKGQKFLKGWGVLGSALGRVQRPIPDAQYDAKHVDAFLVSEDCIRCGLCVKHCPAKNLSMEAEGVTSHHRCTLCFRCVNLCPAKACTVMLHKPVRRQYRKLLPTVMSSNAGSDIQKEDSL